MELKKKNVENMRKMNDYVEKLEEVSEQYPYLLGMQIGIYNSARELLEIRTITGIFKDPDYKNGALVFLLDDGKTVVKRVYEIECLGIE